MFYWKIYWSMFKISVLVGICVGEMILMDYTLAQKNDEWNVEDLLGRDTMGKLIYIKKKQLKGDKLVDWIDKSHHNQQIQTHKHMKIQTLLPSYRSVNLSICMIYKLEQMSTLLIEFVGWSV